MKTLVREDHSACPEERIADLVFSAHRLPGHRLHPRVACRRPEALGE